MAKSTAPATSPATSSSLGKVFQIVAKVHQHKAQGVLSLSVDRRQWFLYFSQGSLAWAVSSSHRARRWHRALQAQKITLDRTDRDRLLWDYEHLSHSLAQGKLRRDQAIAVVRSVAREVCFVATLHRDLVCRWDATLPTDIALDPALTLSTSALEDLFRDVQRLQQAWQATALPPICVDQALVLRPSASRLSLSNSGSAALITAIDGQKTVWDIAAAADAPEDVTVRALAYFVQQEAIAFRTLPDLPSPNALIADPTAASAGTAPATSPVAPTAPKASTAPIAIHAATIVCVDPNPSQTERFRQALAIPPWQFVAINDPLRALAQVVEAHPDLLFIRLVMPVVNGYELCTQLRRMERFKAVPIVMLTAGEPWFDAAYVRTVGATATLPREAPEPEMVAIAQRLLRDAWAKSSGDRPTPQPAASA
jgi:chemotaxis family two-component system response regulator PixG